MAFHAAAANLPRRLAPGTHQAHTPAQARCPDVTGGAPALTRLLLRSKGCPEQARETQKHRPGPKIALYLHSQYLLQLLRCLLLEHTHQTPMRACSTALQCSWCAAADRGALGLQHPHKSQRLHISSGLRTPVSTTHTTKPLYKHTKKLQLNRQDHAAPCPSCRQHAQGRPGCLEGCCCCRGTAWRRLSTHWGCSETTAAA